MNQNMVELLPISKSADGMKIVKKNMIRKAEFGDIDAIFNLISGASKNKKVLPRSREDITRRLSDFYVAVSGGDVVGCVALVIYSPKLAEIRSLVVAPSHRKEGIGKLMVKVCLEEAKSFEIYEVMAITDQPDFFKRCGLKHVLDGQWALFCRP